MKGLLTVAIPTRNRDNYLVETIGSIVAQDEFKDVEIVVCNNSDKKNPNLLGEYAGFGNVSYVENERVLSIDESMIKVANFVKTKYFLWLGDDDFIVKNGLQRILKILMDDEYDFVLLNAVKVSEDLSRKIKATIRIDRDELFTSPQKFFLRHCFHMPFGTLIVKKDLYDTVIESSRRFNGTSHAYSGLVLDCLAQKYSTHKTVNVLVVKDELIQLRQLPKTWRKNATRIMFEEIPEWFLLLDKSYSDEVDKIFSKYISNQFGVRNLIRHRIKFQLNMKNFAKYTAYASTAQKLKYLAVNVLPVIGKER